MIGAGIYHPCSKVAQKTLYKTKVKRQDKNLNVKYMLANAAKEQEKAKGKPSDAEAAIEEEPSKELTGMEKVEGFLECCETYREYFDDMYEENKAELFLTPNVSSFSGQRHF